MVCRVKYFNEKMNAYMGGSYTYITELPLAVYDKVNAPTADGVKKAIVVDVDLPDTAISPMWADRVQTISKYDR